MLAYAPASATFKKARVTPAGDFLTSVAVADFNRDGNTDLVTTDQHTVAPSFVTVLLGNGKGRFPRKRTLRVGDNYPIAVAVGRFDRNRYPDIAVTRSSIPGTDADVKIFKTKRRNRGGIRFKPGQSVFLGDQGISGPAPQAIEAARFTRDRKLDLVVADRNFDVVSFLRGRRNAKFAPEVELPVANAPQDLAVGRLNPGRRLDVATPSITDDAVSILPGRQGAPFFHPVQNFPATDAPHAVAVGDVAGDGRPDFATNSDFDPEVGVFANTGAGFTPVAPIALPDEASQLAIGRLAGNSKPDIAMLVRGSPGALRLAVRKPNGNLKLRPKAYKADFDIANSDIRLAHMNGDRKLDVVASGGSSGAVAVFLHR